MGWIPKANAAVARSPVGRYFRLEGSGHVRCEIEDVCRSVLTAV